MLDSQQSAEKSVLQGLRILVAEEDPRIRSVVTLVFGRLGAETFTATDGVEAFEVLQNQHRKKESVTHLIMDVNMPRMNGVALLRLLRDHAHFNSLPVTIISGPDEERDLYECRCLGIEFNVTKPLKLASLVNYILDEVKAKQVQKHKVESENVIPDTTNLGYPYEFGQLPGDKKYPLRLSYYRCPFCETTFTAPRLCNRAMKPDHKDRLAIGIFSEGMEKDFIEYPLTEIICCPQCVYAADRIGFHRIWTRPTDIKTVGEIPTKNWEPMYFPVTSKLRKIMEDGLEKRLSVLRKADEDGLSLFKIATDDITIPRSPKNAIISYELGQFCTDCMNGYFRGETTARMRHKSAGYMLKTFYIYGLMAAKEKDTQELEKLKKMRVQTMFTALQLLLAVNDMDLEVLEERLYCITRRFFLSDMLIPFMPVKEERQKLATVRKKAISDMKATLIRARQLKSQEVKTIERFLLPLENRMLEIEKKEKMRKLAAAQKNK